MARRRNLDCGALAQRLQLLLRQLAAIVFRETEANVDFPTAALQMRRRDQRVAAVVTFAGKNNAGLRVGKELPNGARDAGAGLVHQRFHLNAARECASSAARICAVLKIGESNQFSESVEVFFFLELLFF